MPTVSITVLRSKNTFVWSLMLSLDQSLPILGTSRSIALVVEYLSNKEAMHLNNQML